MSETVTASVCPRPRCRGAVLRECCQTCTNHDGCRKDCAGPPGVARKLHRGMRVICTCLDGHRHEARVYGHGVLVYVGGHCYVEGGRFDTGGAAGVRGPIQVLLGEGGAA